MIRACALALALALSAAPACADPLGDVVARYIAWRGGPAFEQLKSISEKGAVESSGLHGTGAFWAERGGRSRIDLDLGPLKQSQGVAGARSWDISPSGQVETLSTADLRANGRFAALQFADAIRGRDGASVRLLGQETRAGRLWAVVRLGFGDADAYDAFISPETGELSGFRIQEDRQTRFEAFGDWRMVEGVRMPFLHTTDLDSREVLTTVEVNRPLPSSLFQRPTLPRKTKFLDGAASTGWIDFELFAGNRIYVPVRVNGHETMALLDSGASVSSADTAWARSIGLTSQGAFAGPGTGGVDTFGFVHGVRIEVGNLALDDITVGAFDLSGVARTIGRPLPFILGDEVFNELLVDIDFANHRIAFREPAGARPPKGSVEVPLLRVKDRTVPVSIEGAPPVPFEFDIGSGSPLQIFPSFENTHHLLDGRRRSKVRFGGVGGYRAMDVAMVKRFTFAGVDFPAAPAVFTPDTRSAANSNLIQGNLGLPVYARFHLVIDFAHDRLWAKPNPGARETPFPKDRLGLYVSQKDGALLVDLVSPGSPAEAAGLKAGDRISFIDAKAAGAWTAPELRDLREGIAGSIVTVVLADGAVRRMTLADFY